MTTNLAPQNEEIRVLSFIYPLQGQTQGAEGAPRPKKKFKKKKIGPQREIFFLLVIYKFYLQ